MFVCLGVVWFGFFKKHGIKKTTHGCKPNPTKRTESLPPALLGATRSHQCFVPLSISVTIILSKAFPYFFLLDMKMSTCIWGARFCLYTVFFLIHRRLHIVYRIKSRACSSQNNLLKTKKKSEWKYTEVKKTKTKPHTKKTQMTNKNPHTFLPEATIILKVNDYYKATRKKKN